MLDITTIILAGISGAAVLAALYSIHVSRRAEGVAVDGIFEVMSILVKMRGDINEVMRNHADGLIQRLDKIEPAPQPTEPVVTLIDGEIPDAFLRAFNNVDSGWIDRPGDDYEESKLSANMVKTMHQITRKWGAEIEGYAHYIDERFPLVYFGVVWVSGNKDRNYKVAVAASNETGEAVAISRDELQEGTAEVLRQLYYRGDFTYGDDAPSVPLVRPDNAPRIRILRTSNLPH